MMEGIMGKVMAGWLSLTALMFSSYTGNDPVFKPLQCRLGQNYLIVTAKLDKAFDNDFRDVFNCGKQVVLNFKVEVRCSRAHVHLSPFRGLRPHERCLGSEQIRNQAEGHCYHLPETAGRNRRTGMLHTPRFEMAESGNQSRGMAAACGTHPARSHDRPDDALEI
jgi:hypothetical protein